MIPNYQDRQIDSNGITDMASFGISLDNSAHIMTILRDTLYTDKVLAVLREYSANAWDAHNMVGKGNVPIKVVLPSTMDPTLTIQDFGPGLSHEDVFNIYTQYGASTKRDSNVAVGQLGIGSKSGFAYSDSFTIVSCNGGKRRTYVAILDETEKGTINLLDEADCGEETGISIQIPIRPEDIPEFIEKAEGLFKFFNPRPDINLTLPDEIPVKMRLKTGVIYDHSYSGEWLAVMGCIPYRLNLDQIDTSDIGYWVHKLSGVLFFNIGEVHISASREELKYSKSTKKAIVSRLAELVDEFVARTLDAIQNGSYTSWEKRLQTQILTRFDLPVPKGCEDLAKGSVGIQETDEDFATTFTFKHRDQNGITARIQIRQDSRVVLVDDTRKMSGFNLGPHDYLVFINNPEISSWDGILPELDAYLGKHLLDGIKVVKLSEEDWRAPYVKQKPKKITNPKHFRKSFTLIPNSYYSHPFSDAWAVTDPKRVATDEDVFVLINGFKTDASGFNIYLRYKEDREILDTYGVNMPTIYGYKTTDKKPIKTEDCVGIPYVKWRQKIMAELATGPAKEEIELYDWQRIFQAGNYYGRARHLDLKPLIHDLGPTHMIVQTLRRAKRAEKRWNQFPSRRAETVRELGKIYFSGDTKSEALQAHKAINERYPLIGIGSLESLWGQHSVQWTEYVQLIDRVTPMNVMTLTPMSLNEGDLSDD